MTADKYDVFAFTGQSNSEGHFGYIDNDISRPTGSDVFTQSIETLTGFNTLAIEAATGGSGSNESSNPQSYWWNLSEDRPGAILLEAVANIQNSMTAGQDLDGIIWAQGETDAATIGFSGQPDLYVGRLIEATQKTFEYFRQNLGADVPIFIQEIGNFPDPSGAPYNSYDLVRDAQFQLTQTLDNVYMGADTTDRAYLNDDLHFSTESFGIIADELAETIVEVISDGEPIIPQPPATILGTTGDEFIEATSSDDVIDALAGSDSVFGSAGNDVITGGDGEDQMIYSGSASEYTFTRNTDGSISVVKADGGTDSLNSIESFWFNGSQEWFAANTLAPIIPIDPNGTVTGTSGDDFISSTIGDDIIETLAGDDSIIGSSGNDNVDAGIGEDQMIYEGSSEDYSFTRNADGSITVVKEGGAIDTLTNIETFWFNSSSEWFAAETLAPTLPSGPNQDITGTEDDDFLSSTAADDTLNLLEGDDSAIGSTGSDIINGGEGSDLFIYEGSSADYTFTRNADDTISVVKPDGGIDTLISIESFWFNGAEEWFSADSLAPSSGDNGGMPATEGSDFMISTSADNTINTLEGDDSIIGSAGNDIIDGGLGEDQMIYEGNSDDYLISRNADGTMTVQKPDNFVDQLSSIESFWFNGDQQWFAADNFTKTESIETVQDLGLLDMAA